MRSHPGLLKVLTALALAATLQSLGAQAQEQSVNARLLAAARAGDEAGVTRALKDGAAPNSRSRIGETVLVIALKGDKPAMAQQMIDAGTD